MHHHLLLTRIDYQPLLNIKGFYFLCLIYIYFIKYFKFKIKRNIFILYYFNFIDLNKLNEKFIIILFKKLL